MEPGGDCGGISVVAQGCHLVGRSAGLYQLQAHLAAAHSTATSWSETDWDRIIELYDLLGSVAANPMVALNRAVAVTERDGPEHGLAALEAIVGLEQSHLWHAALADNLRRLAGRQRLPGSWKPPPRWRPRRVNGGCFCPVSST